jgi:hypothetical protein
MVAAGVDPAARRRRTSDGSREDITMALLEPGDGVRLKLVRAERVLPDDIYWGVQRDPRAARKGFILESEGVPVPQGAAPAEYGKVQIGPYWVNEGDLVLVQDLTRDR